MSEPQNAQAGPGAPRRWRRTLARPKVPEALPTPPPGSDPTWFEADCADGELVAAIIGDGTAPRPWLLFVYHIPDRGGLSSSYRYPDFDELLEAVGELPELAGGLYTIPPFLGRTQRQEEARGALLQAKQVGALPDTPAGARWALSLPGGGGAPGAPGANQGVMGFPLHRN